MVQGEQPSTSRAAVTVVKSGISSPTRYVAIENVEHLNMFTLHVKAHCALCSLDQKSGSVKTYQIMQQKMGYKNMDCTPPNPSFPNETM